MNSDVTFVMFVLSWGWVSLVIVALINLLYRWIYPRPGEAHRRGKR